MKKNSNTNISEDEKLIINTKIIKISHQTNNKNAEANAHLKIGEIYFGKGDFNRAIISYNKTKELFSILKNDLKFAQSIFNIGLCNLQLNNFEKALESLNRAIDLYKKLNLNSKIVEANQYIGMINYWRGEYKSALRIYNDCKQYWKKDDFNFSSLLIQIGSLYTEIGEYPKALENLFEAVELNIKYHKKVGLGNAYINIGATYIALDNMEQADNYNQLALDIFEAQNDINGIIKATTNLGIIYYTIGKKEKALRFYKKALKLSKETDDKLTQANILNNLATIHSESKEHYQTIKAYEKVFKIKKDFADKKSIVTILKNIGYEYIQLENYDKAMNNYKQSLKIAEELGMKKMISSLFKNISEINEKKKEFERALDNYKQYSIIKDEIFNKNSINKIAELQAKFEVVQKEKEAEIFRLKNIELEDKNIKIKKQKEQLEQTIKELNRSEVKYKIIAEKLNKNEGLKFVGESESIKKITELISIVAASKNTNVLITGESGTGKEIVAHNIHKLSKRKKNNFYPVNASAIPETLFESQFFGHEKNSFTGAEKTKIGWFEIADKSTLFLDEIGTMSLEQQVKLLRVLEEQKIVRVGSHSEIKIDVRVISATNIKLLEMVELGKFRKDLYYRLATFVINIPPLRERKEDIPLLLHHFAKIYGDLLNKKITGINSRVETILSNYDFPGNVRELRNMVERAILLTKSSTLKPEHFIIPQNREENLDLYEIIPLDEIEKNMIIKALKKVNYNNVQAAKLLNVNRKVIERRIKKYDISTK